MFAEGCGNICGVLPKRLLHHVKGRPLLSGLFAVGKNEFEGDMEIHRLIMNLIPLNNICKSMSGDIGTLPGVSGLTPFLLEKGEVLLLSSEDVRCFFYLFAVPQNWFPYLGFNKSVPFEMVPPEFKGEDCVLHAKVLPMGFCNSVGIAQHVHREVVRRALAAWQPPVTGESEMRRDKAATQAKHAFRVYLDNFDALIKVDRGMAEALCGTVSEESQAVRDAYAKWGLPRHPKKAVESSRCAEVQGAIVDGERGLAYPKPQKILCYVALCWELLRRQKASQRELQVVCGGFVYVCLFRRPLLSALNKVWESSSRLRGFHR